MRRSLLLLVLSLTATIGVSAQFSLAWQKPLGLSHDSTEYLGATCVREIDGYHFIGYQVRIQDKVYPALSFLSPDDSIHRINNFSTNPDIDGYRIVSFVKSAGDTLFALCNDEKVNNGHVTRQPAMMKFSLRNGLLTFIDYYHLNLTDTTNMRDVRVVDGISAGGGMYYIAIAFNRTDGYFVNIYRCRDDQVEKSQTIMKATGARLWWGDDKELVVSSEVPFAPGSSKLYYQIMVLNEGMQTVRTYPETTEYLDSNASDRIVNISYRPSYHLGLVARQVRDLAGVNHLNWFAFNGYPMGTSNKLIGEDKNVLLVENVIHPKEEEVAFNYFYPGSGMNNWAVSTLHRPDLAFDNLILSVENYDGLELVRDTFGKATDAMMNQVFTNPEVLQDLGTGDIDHRHPGVLCFTRDNGPELYVVYNKPSKILERAGLHISKFTLDTGDERLAANYLSKKYGRSVYYSSRPIPAEDKRKWLLVALDPADPLSTQLLPQNQPIQLESDLTPIANTWYWQGDIKLGKKKYHVSKAVISENKIP